jgi:two-component system NarL family sensor kinase
MRHLICLLLLFFSLCTRAQYTPEIKQKIKSLRELAYSDSLGLFSEGKKIIDKVRHTKQDGAIADVYLYYGNYFYYIRNIDRAKDYFTKANKQAVLTKNQHIEDLSHVRLIFIDNEQGINDDAEAELNDMLVDSKEKKDYENTLEIINFLAILKERANLLQESTKLYIEGLDLAESNHLGHYIGTFRNNLGLMKIYGNQFDEALVDFEKGLVVSKKENEKSLMNHIQINMALIYLIKDSTKTALKMFDVVVGHSRKNNHPRELASTFVNIGSAFSTTGRPEMALSYMDSASTVLKAHHMSVELTKAYLGKTDVLVRLKKPAEARLSLKEAANLTTITENPDDKASVFLMLHEIEKLENNYKAALDNYLKYKKLKDSVNETLNSKVLQGLQLKYNVQKKEVELEKEKSKTLVLEKKNQNERFIRYLTILFSAIALILILGMVWVIYSRKVREKQELFSQMLIEKIEEDRSRISMDLHDDIGQSLSMLKSKIISAKSSSHQQEKALESELSRVIEQTREISRSLYPSYLEKIGLVRSVASLSENVQSSTGIECSFDITDKVETLTLNVKTHLYRILQECTNNTIKHSGATALKISITEKNNEFVMTYQDNGSGFGSKQNKGLGILSIKERAKIINGSVHFGDKGSKSFKLILKFKPNLSESF